MAPDTLSPSVLDSGPRGATRLQLESASRMAQGLALADAQQKRAEAFEAADDLLRALRRFKELHTERPQEMRDWLHDTAGGAIDQLSNVMGSIDRSLDEQGLVASEPLDLTELHAFWESVR
jgi:hypothetical protein